MSFTEFTVRSGGSNLNAGTLDGSAEASTSPLATYTNGNWNSVTGVYLPSNSLVAGNTGNAASFVAASGQSLGVADNAALSAGNIDFWVSGWFWFDSLPASSSIILAAKGSNTSAPGNHEWYLTRNTAGNDFRMTVSNGTTLGVAAFTLNAATSAWYHVMGWHDSVNDTINVQVNGGAVTSAAWSTGSWDSTAPLVIGGQLAGSVALTGRATCVAFGKSPPGGVAGVVSAIQTSLYAGGRGKPYASLSSAEKTAWGLVSFWNLGEASGSRADSHSTNNLADTNGVTQAAGVTGNTFDVLPNYFISAYADGASAPTGFVARIFSVNSNSITLSSSAKTGTAPTTAATGVTVVVGGAWLGPNGASGFPFGFNASALTDAAGDMNRANFKNDQTYSITAAMTHATNTAVFQGYSSTFGDGGKATVDGGTTGASYTLLTLSNANVYLVDFIFQNNGATGSASGLNFSSGNRAYRRRVVVHDVRGVGHDGAALAIECEAYNCNQSLTANLAGFRCNAVRCYSHDNSGGSTVGFTSNTAPLLCVHCVADSNGGRGFAVGGTVSDLTLINCDAYNNGTDGAVVNAASYIENCNFVKNGGYGINCSGGPCLVVNCGFGSGSQANTSGQVNGVSGTSGVTVSGSVTYASGVTPWVNPSAGDFRVNLAAAKGAGRGAFTQTGGGKSGAVAYPDVGAAQHQDLGGIPLGRLVGGL